MLSYLYHGTSILNMASILRDNRMESTEHYATDSGPPGVSTTTSKEVAKHFAQRATSAWVEADTVSIPDELIAQTPMRGAIIIFNVPMLLTKYKIEQFENNVDGFDEHEMRILTPGLLNARNFIKDVLLYEDDVKWFAELVDEYPDTGWGNKSPEILELLKFAR